MSHHLLGLLVKEQTTQSKPSVGNRCLSCCANRKLIIVAYSLFLAALLTCAQAKQSDKSSGDPSSSSSLFYTRLRYDNYYLPIYKNLQNKFPYEERRISLRLARDQSHNDAIVDYYANANISLHDLSHNDLILESLDQVYKSRLLQSYEHSYDNPQDRIGAADPAKVNKLRCHRELDYLLSKLKTISGAHENHARPRLTMLDRGLDPELATFFDAYAGQEAGVLVGNIYWLGNWQQCYKRHIFNPSEAVSFMGRYCVASIRPEEWLEKIEQKVHHLKRIDYFRFDQQEFNYRQHFRIQVGICLPESCDSTLIETRHRDLEMLSLMKLNQPFDSYNLTDLYCLPDESSPLRQISPSGRLLIGVSLVWMLLLGLSTLADAYDLVGLKLAKQTRGKRTTCLQKFVASMSLIKSYHYLIHVSRPSLANDISSGGDPQPNGHVRPISEQETGKSAPSSSDLHFMDAFKVLAMLIILLGHTGMILLQFCQYQLDFYTIKAIYFHFLASTAFFVDWFFCMTGFITAYTMFAAKVVYTNKPIHWLYSVFHRYWRLAPIYLLTFWFCRSLFQYTSHGPLWDYGTSNASLRAICQQESWLIPLTLTSNLYPLHRECVMPAWYIANDMQFYLITPLLLLLLAYRTRLAWLGMATMALLSVLTRARRYYTDSHVQHLELMHPRFDLPMRNNWDMHRIYLWPHYRISPYLIGLLAGHYAFMVRSGQWSSPFTGTVAFSSLVVQKLRQKVKQKQRVNQGPAATYLRETGWWPSNRALLAWSGLLLTCSVSMMSWFLDSCFPRSLEPYAKPIATVIYSLGHSIAGCGVASLFLALLFGHWPRVRQFMELPVWTRLARINFFVYLFQVEMIVWANSVQNRLPDASANEQLKLMLYLGPILYALAWLVTLLVANPLAKLELEFVGVFMRTDKPEESGAKGAGIGSGGGPSRAERHKQVDEQVAAARRAAPNGGAVQVVDDPRAPSSIRPIKHSSSSSSSLLSAC